MSQSIAFDRAADYYDVTRGFPPGVETQAAAAIAEAGQMSPDTHVLEIGIGTGRVALPLAAHVGQIEGVDLSVPMLSRLRAKQTSERIRVVQGDVTRLPLRTGTFDVVVAVHIFHLVGDYKAALAEAARVLKPSGVLVHAFGASERRISLDQAWSEIIGTNRGTETGMPWDMRRTVAEDNGWEPVREATADYAETRSPRAYVQQVRDRCWSNTWTLSDEALEAGIARLESFIAEHYPDPDAVETTPARFIARAYRPPQRA